MREWGFHIGAYRLSNTRPHQFLFRPPIRSSAAIHSRIILRGEQRGARNSLSSVSVYIQPKSLADSVKRKAG
jgi:hypothetical protein